MKRRVCLSLLTGLCLTCTLARLAFAQDGSWVNVTNNVGAPKWGAYGVTYMKAVPGRNAVIAA